MEPNRRLPGADELDKVCTWQLTPAAWAEIADLLRAIVVALNAGDMHRAVQCKRAILAREPLLGRAVETGEDEDYEDATDEVRYFLNHVVHGSDASAAPRDGSLAEGSDSRG